jgi:L-threonylcarbamoyladenylate synthase
MVRLMAAPQVQGALDVLGPDAKHIAVYARAPLKTARGIFFRRMPDDAAQAAQALFAVLRELDATGVKLIWVETPPEGADWDGVRDRLQRASA